MKVRCLMLYCLIGELKMKVDCEVGKIIDIVKFVV